MKKRKTFFSNLSFHSNNNLDLDRPDGVSCLGRYPVACLSDWEECTRNTRCCALAVWKADDKCASQRRGGTVSWKPSLLCFWRRVQSLSSSAADHINTWRFPSTCWPELRSPRCPGARGGGIVLFLFYFLYKTSRLVENDFITFLGKSLIRKIYIIVNSRKMSVIHSNPNTQAPPQGSSSGF